jgi:cell division protein FtsL
LEVRQTGYDIERLERRLVELRNLERRLDLENSYLSSPARLESEASALLGMALPTLEDMIFVEEP